MTQVPILVELDGRRRASLARLNPTHDHYQATIDPAGVITMRPVELVPAVVGQHPAMLASIGEADPEPATVQGTIAKLRKAIPPLPPPPPDVRPFKAPPGFEEWKP